MQGPNRTTLTTFKNRFINLWKSHRKTFQINRLVEIGIV